MGGEGKKGEGEERERTRMEKKRAGGGERSNGNDKTIAQVLRIQRETATNSFWSAP